MNLKGKVEAAFALLINTHADLPAALHDQVYLGADDDTQHKPCVICEAQAGESEEPMMLGNRLFRVKIHVCGQAELESGNPVDLHNAAVSAVFGILKSADAGEEWGETLAKRLSAQQADFYVYPPVTDAGEDPELRGRAFVDSIMLDCFCCNADLT
jgi:extradiol dioxygenase family protein